MSTYDDITSVYIDKHSTAINQHAPTPKPCIDWTQYKYFTASENWGDPDMMQHVLIAELERLRTIIRGPIIILSGYRDGDTGTHGAGIAADIYASGVNTLDLYIEAIRLDFRGVGLYPEWRPNGGIHVDMRTAVHRALWGATYQRSRGHMLTANGTKKQIYHILDHKFICKNCQKLLIT